MTLLASVIIPAYNASGSIGECLAALSRQTLPAADFEVIVVDDGSTDTTATVAEGFAVRVVRGRHGGPAAARNLGASLATGQYLLFTDADCVPEPDWMEHMLRPLLTTGDVGVKGVYRTHQRALTARFAQVEFEEKYRRLARAASIDFIDTYSAAYRREVFQAFGGFDTTFTTPSAEDQELSFRLSEAGYTMRFSPAAVVYHTHPTHWWWYTRRKARFGYWQVLNRLRHPGKILSDSYTPQTQRLQLVLLALLAPATLAGLLLRQWLPAATVLAAFAASGLPLMRLAWRLDRGVAPYVPVMLALRAGGVLAGVAGALLSRRLTIGAPATDKPPAR